MGDSIYGVPEVGSPSSHEQFVQQLQPIAELPSPPPGTAGRISPEVAAVLPASHTNPSMQHAAVTHCQASIKQQSVQGKGVTEVAAASASPCNGPRSAPLHLASARSSLRSEPAAAHTAATTAGVHMPETLRELLAASNTSGTRVSWEQHISPRCHNRPPPLRLDSSSSSRHQAAQPTTIGSGSNASIPSGSNSGNIGSNSIQQQDGPQHFAAIKEVAGSVNAGGSVEQLLQARRPSNNSVRTASTHIAQKNRLPAAAAAIQSVNTVGELIRAAQVPVASADRWKVAAGKPVHSPVAEPGPRQTSHPSQTVQLQRQHQQSKHRDTSSVNDLVNALRRATDNDPGSAAAAIISNADSAVYKAPLHEGEQRASQDDSSNKIASLIGAWQQVKEQAQQSVQAPNAAIAAAGSGASSVIELEAHKRPVIAVTVPPESAELVSSSTMPDLVAVLRAATGDSRRGIAEVAVAAAAAVPLPQSQQQDAAPAASTAEVPVASIAGVNRPQSDGNPSTALGSFQGVDELIQALSRATASSIRTTRESETYDELAAGSQPTTAVPTTAVGAYGSSSGQGRFGSIANVDELILALRRATGSRRSTAESAIDPTGLLQQEQQEQDAADASFDSIETLDDLLKAISRATSNSSRRNTSDLIAGDQQNNAQQGRQQQQQQLVDVDKLPLGESSSDPSDQGLTGSFSDVDTLLQALRRATGSRRGTSDLPADADSQQEEQQGALSGNGSSLEELLNALQRPTAGNRRGTAEPLEAATVPAVALPSAADATAAEAEQQQQEDLQPLSSSNSMLKLARALQVSAAGGNVVTGERPAATAGLSSQVMVTASQQQQQQLQTEQNFPSDGVDQLIKSLRIVSEQQLVWRLD